MVASVFPLAMGRDAAQVCVPLPRPRALRSDTALGWCTSGEITRRWQSKAGQASRPSRQAGKQAGKQADECEKGVGGPGGPAGRPTGIQRGASLGRRLIARKSVGWDGQGARNPKGRL